MIERLTFKDGIIAAALASTIAMACIAATGVKQNEAESDWADYEQGQSDDQEYSVRSYTIECSPYDEANPWDDNEFGCEVTPTVDSIPGIRTT